MTGFYPCLNRLDKPGLIGKINHVLIRKSFYRCLKKFFNEGVLEEKKILSRFSRRQTCDRYLLDKRNLLVVAAIIAPVIVAGLTFTSTQASGVAAVTIHADNDRQVVTTDATSVGEALERAGIAVGEYDIVEPALEAEITNNTFNINVYRSRPVVVADGEEVFRIESAHQSPRLIAKKAEEIEIYEEDVLDAEVVTDFLDSDYIGYQVNIIRATPVNLDLAGNSTVFRTHAETVAGLLKDAQIEIGANDIVEPALDAPLKEGMKVSFTRVGFEVVIKEEAIEYPTELVYDNNRPLGYEKIEEPGVKGLALVTYEMELRNGQEVNRKRLHRTVESEPEARVVVVGNRAELYSNDLDRLLYDLRICEAGGRYNANTGNGFYGAYQFMISTWDRIAARIGRNDLVGVSPHLASPSDQDMMVVENARASAGGFWSQHPGCSQSLGLPQFP